MLDAGRRAGATVLPEPPVHQTSPQTAPASRSPVELPPPPPASMPAERPGHRRTSAGWLGVVAMLYLLICAIGLIGDGFNGLGEQTAHNLFTFAANPVIALFVGILVTAIIQSSSTTTALVVASAATGAMPLSVAIPLIMGANIGTSVTNTLASLGHIGDKGEFRRAFSASTVHDFFNLTAVAILLPFELLFHPLERLSGWIAGTAYGTVLPDPGQADFIGLLSGPVVDALGTHGMLGVLGAVGGGTAGGIATIVLGVAMIFLAVRYMGKLLQTIMVGKARTVLERTVGGNPLVAMGAGAGVTAVVQSSSVTTSMLVPFAGSGTLSTRQIYPITLGANVGTTITALLAAFAVAGGHAELALQVAFVHVLFNVLGILIIFGLPFLRYAPVRCAELLARVAAERKAIAASWVVSVFLAIPAMGVFLFTLT